MDNQATASRAENILSARGVSRRSFMKMCGTVAVMAGLGQAAAPRVAEALEQSVIGATEGNLFPVIWIEGASCTGCTESFAQSADPDPASVVLELISCNYCETLSAAAGHSMELAKEQTIQAGNYILVYEGAITRAFDGWSLRVAEETGIEILKHAAENAAAVVAAGSCAVNGGWLAADPNPADACGVQEILTEAGIATPVINIPGCPVNPENLVATLVSVILLGQVPELDGEGKPKAMFNQTIHDNCERRGHFENGEFVYEFGSEEEALGYCLYPLGCRGPQTYANCSVVRWNAGVSWCVASGAPCIGCCEANPNNPSQNWVQVNTPFYKRHCTLRIGNFIFQPTTVAAGLTAIVAGALVIHGFGMKAAGRAPHGADFEDIRVWDAKHLDQSVGQYDEAVIAAAKEAQKGGKN
ncbi:hydrogenase small subunit [Slackia heliotrinireducens]|uniref:hydrogenase small subunit n=1 Tax=Slackia heliotrinireducens TaxID=84110 RepID=UPI00331599DE